MKVHMLNFRELNLGFLDAENYRDRENKNFFNKIFLKDDNLEKLLSPSISYLIGEKGTGKTAYATFLANNEYKDTISYLKYIRETDYTKFIELKRLRNLSLSDFSSIWKVILLLLMSKEIKDYDLDINFLSRRAKLSSLLTIIDDYYSNAFSPEIINALSVVETEELLGKLKIPHAEIGASTSTSATVESKKFQIELLRIERDFKSALSELKLKKNIVLLIDGIDIRPGSIDYPDYLLCIKGLADAVWSLNRDFFANIRDSRGRMRVVLLTRPDIFNSLGLQNDANKIRDNSVLLDWKTTYPEYRGSKIFKLINKLLSVQQIEELEEGKAWDYYFPWSTPSTNLAVRDDDPSFISFLRLSYSRPRDIIASLLIIQDKFQQDSSFCIDDTKDYMKSNEFKGELSEHMLRSIKNQIAFYYTDNEYDVLIQFFDFLTSPDFSWEKYIKIFQDYQKQITGPSGELPEFAANQEDFLQFLYETNIICYIEDMEYESMVRWCYRERQVSRIAPKVKHGLRYQVHYGLQKALNLGHQRRRI